MGSVAPADAKEHATVWLAESRLQPFHIKTLDSDLPSMKIEAVPGFHPVIQQLEGSVLKHSLAKFACHLLPQNMAARWKAPPAPVGLPSMVVL